MKQILIFGLSGQVGDALQFLLSKSDFRTIAVSRFKKADGSNIAWQLAGFENFESAGKNYDALISLGPLDAFSAWLQSSNIVVPKIIALSSTSAVTKQNSPDPNERKLAQLLLDSEQTLVEHAEKISASLIILRPTLIYGVGRDQSLSRWLELAKRFKFVVLPIDAGGLRQPVHVADVADAVFKALSISATDGLVLDLPGGETLAFDQMLLRSLQAHAPGTRVVRIPSFLFRLLLQLAAIAGLGRGLGAGFFARLREDWVFDASSAHKHLDYRPRPFSP